jgi:predicted nucleotidyltransferase
MFYEKVFRALNKSRLKYLVIGGIAVNMYGLHRLTRDLDLVIDLSEENLNKFIKVIEKLGYKPSIPPNKWGSLTAIAFHNPNKEFEDRIDVFLKPIIKFKDAYKRRKVFNVGGLRVSCVSLKDLMALKDKANRLRDWIDIGSLKRMQELRKRKK